MILVTTHPFSDEECQFWFQITQSQTFPNCTVKNLFFNYTIQKSKNEKKKKKFYIYSTVENLCGGATRNALFHDFLFSYKSLPNIFSSRQNM